MYYSIIIIVTGCKQSYLSLSIVIILISLFIGKTENFGNNEKEEKCYKPTDENPFISSQLVEKITKNLQSKIIEIN